MLITAVCSLCCIAHFANALRAAGCFDDAYAYLIVIFLGIPFTLLYNLLSSILRSVGDSRTPFLFLAISTVLNIGLDLLCIIVFKWGVAGAAIATIAAQAVSGILCLIYIASAYRSSRFPAQTAKRMPNPSVTSSSWASPWDFKPPSRPSAHGHAGSEQRPRQRVCFGLHGRYAPEAVLHVPFDALGSAVSVFCGQNLGAKKPERIRQGVRLGVIVGVATASASALS